MKGCILEDVSSDKRSLVRTKYPINGQKSGLGNFLVIIRRYHHMIAAICVAMISLGAIYGFMTAPTFTASAQIFFEPKRPPAVGNQAEINALQLSIDSSLFESQVQLLRSEQVSLEVIRARGLLHDEEMVGLTEASRSGLFGWWQKQSNAVNATQEAMAATTFNNHLNVRRIGTSYVIEVSFWSNNAKKSAQIVNSILAVFIRDQLKGKAEQNRRGEVLEERINETRAATQALETALRTGEIEAGFYSIADARVITAARSPINKSGPLIKLILAFCAALGLVLGLLVAAFRASLDRSVHSCQDIDASLDVAFLGAVKIEGPQPIAALALNWAGKKLKIPRRSTGPELSMQRLKMQIDERRMPNMAKCIGVSSCNQNDFSINLTRSLANMYASSGSRVLIMELAHQPTQQVFLADRHRSFLGDLFTQEFKLEQKPETPLYHVKNITFSETDLMTPNRGCVVKIMQALKISRDHFDIIFIQFPGFATSLAAEVIGPQLDTNIVVARLGHTLSGDVSELLAHLAQCKAKILGFVLYEFKY